MRVRPKLVLLLCMAAILVAAIGFMMAKKFTHTDGESMGVSEKTIVKTFLRSPFLNQESYDVSFSRLGAVIPNPDIRAGIISHHFLARDLIANFYNQVGNRNIDTVYLVSPDHFNNFFKSGVIAYTSLLPWQTPFGELSANTTIIDQLIKNDGLEANNDIVGLEHGVSTETPFIKKFFPNATIVPIIVKDTFKYDDFIALGTAVRNNSGEHSILIVSSDFTHNASAAVAKQNDISSIEILKQLDTQKLNGVTSDCRACLAVLSGYLGQQPYHFALIKNENSFDISGQDPNSVTSYVSAYYTQKEFAQILFVGDLMFDRFIRQTALQKGNDFIFQPISDVLKNNDLVVANLEGPLTNHQSVSANTIAGSDENYIFTFDPSLAKTLFQQNITLVNIGNNHILNFGGAGLASTKNYLKNAGVEYFGNPVKGEQDTIIKTINGIKIGIVNYNQFVVKTNQARTDFINEIKMTKAKSDVLVVYTHWGIEYVVDSPQDIKDLAHQFIDAGADLIIGSHPHVVGSVETYHGKRIYYSLGNFVFDQYFNEQARQGLGVQLKIDWKTKQLNFNEIKFYLQTNVQTSLVGN